jgi:hypothetical protein
MAATMAKAAVNPTSRHQARLLHLPVSSLLSISSPFHVR